MTTTVGEWVLSVLTLLAIVFCGTTTGVHGAATSSLDATIDGCEVANNQHTTYTHFLLGSPSLIARNITVYFRNCHLSSLGSTIRFAYPTPGQPYRPTGWVNIEFTNVTLQGGSIMVAPEVVLFNRPEDRAVAKEYFKNVTTKSPSSSSPQAWIERVSIVATNVTFTTRDDLLTVDTSHLDAEMRSLAPSSSVASASHVHLHLTDVILESTHGDVASFLTNGGAVHNASITLATNINVKAAQFVACVEAQQVLYSSLAMIDSIDANQSVFVGQDARYSDAAMLSVVLGLHSGYVDVSLHLDHVMLIIDPLINTAEQLTTSNPFSSVLLSNQSCRCSGALDIRVKGNVMASVAGVAVWTEANAEVTAKHLFLWIHAPHDDVVGRKSVTAYASQYTAIGGVVLGCEAANVDASLLARMLLKNVSAQMFAGNGAKMSATTNFFGAAGAIAGVSIQTRLQASRISSEAPLHNESTHISVEGRLLCALRVGSNAFVSASSSDPTQSGIAFSVAGVAVSGFAAANAQQSVVVEARDADISLAFGGADMSNTQVRAGGGIGTASAVGGIAVHGYSDHSSSVVAEVKGDTTISIIVGSEEQSNGLVIANSVGDASAAAMGGIAVGAWSTQAATASLLLGSPSSMIIISWGLSGEGITVTIVNIHFSKAAVLSTGGVAVNSFSRRDSASTLIHAECTLHVSYSMNAPFASGQRRSTVGSVSGVGSTVVVGGIAANAHSQALANAELSGVGANATISLRGMIVMGVRCGANTTIFAETDTSSALSVGGVAANAHVQTAGIPTTRISIGGEAQFTTTLGDSSSQLKGKGASYSAQAVGAGIALNSYKTDDAHAARTLLDLLPNATVEFKTLLLRGGEASIIYHRPSSTVRTAGSAAGFALDSSATTTVTHNGHSLLLFVAATNHAVLRAESVAPRLAAVGLVSPAPLLSLSPHSTELVFCHDRTVSPFVGSSLGGAAARVTPSETPISLTSSAALDNVPPTPSSCAKVAVDTENGELDKLADETKKRYKFWRSSGVQPAPPAPDASPTMSKLPSMSLSATRSAAHRRSAQSLTAAAFTTPTLKDATTTHSISTSLTRRKAPNISHTVTERGQTTPSSPPPTQQPIEDTPVPTTRRRVTLSTVVNQQQQTATTVAATSTVVTSVVVGPSTLGSVGRVGGAMRILACPLTQDNPTPSHYELPLQVAVGSGRLATYAGSCLACSAAVALLQLVSVGLYFHLKQRPLPPTGVVKMLLELLVAISSAMFVYLGPNSLGAATTVIVHGNAMEQWVATAAIVVVLVVFLPVGYNIVVMSVTLVRAVPQGQFRSTGNPHGNSVADRNTKFDFVGRENSSTSKSSSSSSGERQSDCGSSESDDEVSPDSSSPTQTIDGHHERSSSSTSSTTSDSEVSTITLHNHTITTTPAVAYYLLLSLPYFDATSNFEKFTTRSYLLVEFIAASAVQILAGVRPADGCTKVAVGILAVSVAMLLYLIVMRPYRTKLDTLFSVVVNALQVVLTACTLATLRDESLGEEEATSQNVVLFDAINALLTALLAVYFIQVVVQAGWAWYVYERRRRFEAKKLTNGREGEEFSDSSNDEDDDVVMVALNVTANQRQDKNSHRVLEVPLMRPSSLVDDECSSEVDACATQQNPLEKSSRPSTLRIVKVPRTTK